MKTYYRGIIKNESKEAEVYLPDYVAVVGKFVKYEGDSMWKVVKVYGGAKILRNRIRYAICNRISNSSYH